MGQESKKVGGKWDRKGYRPGGKWDRDRGVNGTGKYIFIKENAFLPPFCYSFASFFTLSLCIMLRILSSIVCSFCSFTLSAFI